MKRKIISVIITAIITGGLISGCGEQPPTTPKVEVEEKEEKEEVVKEEEKVEKNDNERIGKYIVVTDIAGTIGRGIDNVEKIENVDGEKDIVTITIGWENHNYEWGIYYGRRNLKVYDSKGNELEGYTGEKYNKEDGKKEAGDSGQSMVSYYLPEGEKIIEVKIVNKEDINAEFKFGI